jgi:hypothetical protein
MERECMKIKAKSKAHLEDGLQQVPVLDQLQLHVLQWAAELMT